MQSESIQQSLTLNFTFVSGAHEAKKIIQREQTSLFF